MPDKDKNAQKPTVLLTIAGFDPSSGAGVTADLQVFAAHGMFGTAAITALTVQSPLGVAGVDNVDPNTLRATLSHLAADLPPAGIKIGMLGSKEAVLVVAEFLRTLSDVSGGNIVPVVLDPVLRSSSGAELLTPAAEAAMRSELLPLVSWITPNQLELQQLAGGSDKDVTSLLTSLGRQHSELHIVATGGDAGGVPKDVLRTSSGDVQEFTGERVETRSSHGTGCAFSSALLCRLVMGEQAGEAVKLAKSYVEGGLRRAPGLGHGAGPLDLLWPLRDC